MEDALDSQGFFYEKSEVWIPEEKLYEVMFSFTVPEGFKMEDDDGK